MSEERCSATDATRTLPAIWIPTVSACRTKSIRLAVSRPFRNGKINVGVNMMIARGHTGQTVENFAIDNKPGYTGPLPAPQNPIAEIVGVRIPSYASLNFTYRFGR